MGTKSLGTEVSSLSSAGSRDRAPVEVEAMSPEAGIHTKSAADKRILQAV